MVTRGNFLRFPGGKKKAVTLSYDDGVDQDEQLIERMKKYKMKGTFNVSSGWLAEEGTVYPEGETHRRMSKSQCINVYDKSVVEVAAHGYTHPFMTQLPPGSMMEQVVEDRKKLEEMFDCIINGMAYPYGVYDDTVVDVLRLAGIKYCRTVNSSELFYLPQDWLRLDPTCHHDDENLMMLTEKFLADEQDFPMLFYLWGHTFEFERNDNWNVIEDFMKKISGKENIWYATNMEIYNYVKAFEALDFSADGTIIHNPTATDLWFCLDGKDYKISAGDTMRTNFE